MTKEKPTQRASYQSVHNRARFWLHSEACYTEEELTQRELILKARANSNIHADYLTNPSSWFADDSQALINVYEHSWFYSNAFKTRQVLTRDDFHVQPIDSQRLQWLSLYELMQKTGDYLLVRNQWLSTDHCNQPINFFLLDLNHILKGICQNSHIKQTKEQLEYLTHYVRTVEKNLSPFVSSDRLFLANFRHTIETQIQPQLSQMIESQLLKDRLGELSKTIRQLSTDRNRILHFALNINPVNPHPYSFDIDKPDDLLAFPTQAVKECGKSTTALIESPLSTLKLTIEQLKVCPHFELISMQDKILDHYTKAISDLNELDQFQKVILQIIDLLNQAGEIYTVHQFKEQLSAMFKQIECFIDNSSEHINEILQANTQAYHKAIQDEQNLSFLKKWFSTEREKLATFIQNQDTLAQFPSSTTDLTKTSHALKEHVRHVIVHLETLQSKKNDFLVIAGKTQELNILMDSMHRWITVQHEVKGLTPPKAPEKIQLLAQHEDDYLSSTQTRPRNSFFEESQSKTIAEPKCIPLSYERSMYPATTYQPPALAPCPANQRVSEYNLPNTNLLNMQYIGLLALIPIGLLAIYLLYQSRNKSLPKIDLLGSKEDYEKIKTDIDDLIIEIQRVKDSDNQEIEHAYEDFIETYKQIDAPRDGYNVEALQDLFDDLKYFYEEYFQKNTVIYGS